MTTSEQCEIGRLPVELLELVASQIPHSDLLAFRASCRAFAEVASDAFAQKHFDEISCFFPDPTRLKRLHSIASQPYLAKHIRMIYLTLDPFEYNEDALNFVTPANDRGGALPYYQESYQIDQLEYLCSLQPDLSMITSSLRNLNPLRCDLHIDLGKRHYFYNHIEWANISQRCLAAVAKAVYPIYDLTILSSIDIRDPYPSMDDEREVQRCAGLFHRLYCTPLYSASPEQASQIVTWQSRAQDDIPDMTTFPATSKDEETLGIIFWHRIPSLGSPMQPFAGEILASNRSTQLRHLTLVRVLLDAFGPLLRLLEQCYGTVEAILLHEVEIVPEEAGLWRKLFEMMAMMPNLKHLNLHQLWLGRSGMAPLMILDREFQFAWSCYRSGHNEVSTALRDVLCNSPQFWAHSNGSQELRDILSA